MGKHSSLKASGDGMKRLAELAKELGRRPSVKIGVFADDGTRNDGYSNVQIAIVNEFREDVGPDGAGPARSFLRSTADEKKEEWLKLMTNVLGKAVHGKIELKPALELVGQRASADVRKRIVSGDGIPPPNADSTIEAKGSSRPLVDTAQLLNSISYTVEKG